jgi:RNA polymerase sigma-70 factor, ECF subfamily
LDSGPSDVGQAKPANARRFGEAFAVHAPVVRRHLLRVGVPDADVDDLVQEVFLLLHRKREVVDGTWRIDPWLREVCRRVAAAYRRRAHRRHEVTVSNPPDEPSAGHTAESSIEKAEDEERLHSALGGLDAQSRDLIAMHVLGGLPLGDVASLVEADPKTVGKRVSVALRRLSSLFAKQQGLRAHAAAIELQAEADVRVASPHGHAQAFQLLAEHPDVRIGVVGDVVIAVWPGPSSLETLELLERQIARALETRANGFVYFAVVEATTRPPNLAARQKIVAMLKQYEATMRVCLTALEGGAAWIAKPIMTGLALLVRPPFSSQFFDGSDSAVRWLAQQPGLAGATEQEMLAALRQLRRP